MHVDEDKLLAYALETLDDPNDKREVASHIENCRECRSRLQRMKDDIEIIGGIRPARIITPAVERSFRPRLIWSLVRAAVLVLCGIGIGFGISAWLDDTPAPVSGFYAELTPPPDSISHFAPSDATGIAIELE